MILKKQNTSLTVNDWSSLLSGVSNQKSLKHGLLLPESIRCLICGPSNCGKTNVLLALLLDPNGVKFYHVYLYSKSLNQPKYAFLREILKRVDDLSFHTFNDKSEVIAPEEAEEDSVVVFDDVALEDQDAIRQYFAMGRHRSLDCFYLCQTYSKIPKQLVRDNANLIVLFKQDELNLKHAYNDHVNTDMSWEDFQEICKKCWEGRYTFLVIDKERDINKGRYRKGFDTFINTNYDDDDDDSDDV